MSRTTLPMAARWIAAAAALAACAEEREPIDRTQPNQLEKKFFIGEDFADPKDDPEFWAQATLVDVGYGAAQDGLFTSTYAQPMSRIKWVVQEHLLLARLTYERIADSDGKGAGPTSSDGIVVAAFHVESHFDIQREYNPATGEETNVVSENMLDRPWNERSYMRVDFSKNLNVDSYDFDTLSQIGVYGGVEYESLSYYVNDPESPDAPHFDVQAGVLNYFDVTNKAFARPKMVDLRRFGWGIDEFPACYLDGDFAGGTSPSGTCNPVELTIRHAFRRVVDHDYEPADWDGNRFQAYGAFTSDRYGYARNYGMVDQKWHRFINRYNLWQRSHHYTDPLNMLAPVECFTPATTPAGSDPHRDLDRDGTEDECKVIGKGSRCDAFSQRCTLPYRDRTALTQPWYYTSGSDPEYFDGTDWAAHEWDVALRSAVMTARYAECARVDQVGCEAGFPVLTGQMDEHEDAVNLTREVDDCRRGRAYAGQDCAALASTIAEQRGYSRAVVALAKQEEMVVLCHSPVEDADHPSCGQPRLPAGVTAAACAAKERSADLAASCAAALSVRNGDLRYHQVNVIGTPQTPSPWGIMVDAHDPLTGEKVSASINAWSHVTDLWSQGTIDLARYVKGELRDADVTEGTYIRDWARASESANGGGRTTLTKDELDQRIAAFLNVSAERLRELDPDRGALDANLLARLDRLSREVKQIRADATAPTSTRAKYEARRQRARGTALEAELTTKMLQERAGAAQLGAGLDAIAVASPLRGATATALSEIDQRRELALADRGACVLHEAPAPMSVANLAELLEDKFEGRFGPFNADDPVDVQLERAEAMRRYLAQRAHYAVIAHEMGHSIGLRHNFVSSSDAWGYRPEYWQLRTDDGATTAVCTGAAGEPNCVGPRWFDPINENEKKNMLWMFMQSSVMDYAGEATQDLLGLGIYDYAATRMFYGESVSVHADPSYLQGTRRSFGMIDKLNTFGGIVGIAPTIGDGSGGIRDLHYSELQNRYQLIRDCREVDPQTYRPAGWNEARDGAFHPLLDATVVKVDGKFTRCRQQPVDYVRWQDLGPSENDKVSAVDAGGRVRMPYGFATDRWADLGNVSVYRHDNGADPYEIFDFLITQQEVMHVFDNYRRHRQGFTIRGAIDRAFGRYNAKLRDGAKGLGLLLNVYKDVALEAGYDFEQLWPYIAKQNFANNILASQMVFDHFARILQRPQPGPHRFDAGGILRSDEDSYANAATGPAPVNVPNGATGYLGNTSFGGKPLNNALATDRGEYDAEYTTQAGSYYEKANTAILFTESVDNFISSSRRDFLDARFRAVSLADLFPDGFRRLLANNLTGDDELRGPRVATNAAGAPLLDRSRFPQAGIGWTSWWHPDGPQVCVPQADNRLCSTEPARTAVLDPQIGWEQQKFLIAYTLQYLPENQQQEWINMIGMWEVGADEDPGFPNRIEFHDPSGRTYIAKTFGTEVIFGKRVQKGVAARVLEYANELLPQAYEVTPGTTLDAAGKPLWWVPVFSADGRPIVKFDPSLIGITPEGTGAAPGKPGCNATDNSQCTCLSNRACMSLSRYTELPFFIRQAFAAYGLADPSMKGIY